MGQADGASHGDVVCEGRCPECGRHVQLTWQRTLTGQRGGEVDRCSCGLEAVLVVETRDLLQWFWRDPAELPASFGSSAVPPCGEEVGRVIPPVQLHLV